MELPWSGSMEVMISFCQKRRIHLDLLCLGILRQIQVVLKNTHDYMLAHKAASA